ncbi:MAG TPA: gluconate 2-dehydrogenase subunit 3 family protein [Vicinamibacteria bacterium]|nr:gluconate 2-dehydrogenase subunit 3 family protein [Vicinamibacteria bacterium]
MTSPVDRRVALKTLGATALASFAPNELLAVARSLHTQIDEQRYVFKSLDVEQGELVAVVTELIIPETDTPGARAARVDAFIDLMLTEWFADDERHRFLQGLARLANQDFLRKDGAQRVAILRALEEEALAAPEPSPDAPAKAPFFSVMKWLTLYGYFTSKVAMEQELDPVLFHGTYEGCAPLRR